MLSKLVSVLKTEPNVVLYGLNALLAMLVAFGVHASPGQTGAVMTIAGGVIAVVTAASTRPVAVPAIVGAVSTVATAAASFGLHLSSAQLGAALPVLSLVLSLVLRQAVTPVAKQTPPAPAPAKAARA